MTEFVRVWHPSGLFTQTIPASDLPAWREAGWLDHNPTTSNPPRVEGSSISRKSRLKEKK